MTHTENDQPDTLTRSDQKLRDLLTIRSYLRDRRDELHENGWHGNAKMIGDEVDRLNLLITIAEAAQ
jgi:hypothetical protein